MKSKSGWGVTGLSAAVALVAMVAGCSGELTGDGTKSCENAKDVKLVIKLKDGHPVSVKHDNLFQTNAEFAVVCPGRKLSWKLSGSRGFTIQFKTTTPFAWPDKHANGGDTLEETVPAAPYGGYAYTVHVDNSDQPLDPIIIVDR